MSIMQAITAVVNSMKKIINRDVTDEMVKLTRLAIPLCVTFLSIYFITLTELIIVGRLGVVELAAVGLAFDMIIMFDLIGIGLLTTLTVLVTQALSRGDERQVAVILRTGLMIALFLGLLGMGWVSLVPKLMEVTGQDPRVLPPARTYVVAVVLSILPVFFSEVFSSIASARGQKMLNRVAIIWAVGVAVNIPFTWFMVLGTSEIGGDFKGWGLTGAGISRVMITAAIAGFEFYFCGARDYLISAKGEMMAWLTRHEFKEAALKIVKQGLPVALSFFFEFTMFVAIGLMIGRYGADWLAANKMVVTVLELAFFISSSFAMAGMIRVTAVIEQPIADRTKMIRRIGLTALFLAMSIMTVFIGMMVFFPRVIVGFFLDLQNPENQAAIGAAVILFAIAGIFQILDTVQTVMSRLLRGFQDVRLPMIIALSGYWGVGVAGGMLVSHYSQQPASLWWALASGLGMVAFLMSWRFWYMSGRFAKGK